MHARVGPPGCVDMRLLVVEDELKLAAYLHKGLTEEGFVVDVAHNGVDGLHLAMECDYDLLVLDAMLPGIDGLGVLAALRQSKQTPVLMLTARIRVEDRVKGLQSGADDYLVKPFAFSELVARIQVLLRRARPLREADGAAVLGLADLELDLLRRRATRAGRRLDLTAKEFNLLALLLRRQGEVLSRTEIAEQVWDMNFDSATNVIDVAIRRLRGKLDVPFKRALLHTVRGMGYVLEARDP
jgi:heavy metal response regulator